VLLLPGRDVSSRDPLPLIVSGNRNKSFTMIINDLTVNSRLWRTDSRNKYLRNKESKSVKIEYSQVAPHRLKLLTKFERDHNPNAPNRNMTIYLCPDRLTLTRLFMWSCGSTRDRTRNPKFWSSSPTSHTTENKKQLLTRVSMDPEKIPKAKGPL